MNANAVGWARSEPRSSLPRLLLALVLSAVVASAHAALAEIPELAARVTDTTHTLSASTLASLERRLADYERTKGAQIVVLMVPTTRPEEIEQYSIRVADHWKIGREKSDDGAILLIAKNDRKLRIEVGYGLEGALTDAKCKRIIRELIVPRFFEGDFNGGVTQGVEGILKVVDGELLPPPEGDRSKGSGPQNALPVLAFLAFVIGRITRAIFGTLFGATLTGLATGGVAYVILQTLTGAAFGFVGGFILALLFGAGGGGRWSSRRGSGPFGGPFISTGGGFGGGGFGGGFSGGGGGFGGGGASGNW